MSDIGSSFLAANNPETVRQPDAFSGFSQFTGGLEQVTARAAEAFAKDPATRQMYGERRERKEAQDIQLKMMRRKELLDQSNILTELIAKNPQAMQSKSVQQLMQTISSERLSLGDDTAALVQAQMEVAASMPSEAQKPVVLAPGAAAFDPNTREQLFANPRAEGGAQSPAGKLLADRMELSNQFGEDSAEVKRFDAFAQNEQGVKLTDISAMRSQFTQGAKTFVDVRDAFNRIDSSIKNPSPAADLSLIFGYMRMLDPASTVREGEFATAQQTTGVPGRIVNWYNRVLSGERLSDAQRADFYRQAQGLLQKSLGTHTELENDFASRAQRAGIDPRDVVVDFVGALRGGQSAAGGMPTQGQPAPTAQQGGNKFDAMSADQLLNVDVNSLTPEQEAAYEAAMKKKGF